MCASPSAPLDVPPGLDGARGHTAFPSAGCSLLCAICWAPGALTSRSIASSSVRCALSQPASPFCAPCWWKVYPEKDESLPRWRDFWLLPSPHRCVGSGCVLVQLGRGCRAPSEGTALPAWQGCFLQQTASAPGGVPRPVGTARRRKGAEPDPSAHVVFGSKSSCCLERLFPGAGRGVQGWKQPEDGAGPAAPLSPWWSHGKAAVLGLGTVCTRVPSLVWLLQALQLQ